MFLGHLSGRVINKFDFLKADLDVFPLLFLLLYGRKSDTEIAEIIIQR